jgi:hypothetical protein
MKRVIFATIAILTGLSACTVRSERTVVEHPAPAQTAYVVTDPPPPPPATIVVHNP